MDEHNFRSFQAAMQVVSTIGAVIVFFVGLDRYNDEQAKLLETRITAEKWARDREFRRELWLRQLDVLSKIAGTASRIAATVVDGESTAFDTAVRDYEQLYWGNITFVDDPALVRAMVISATRSDTSVKDSSRLVVFPQATRSSREPMAWQPPADVPSAKAARNTSHYQVRRDSKGHRTRAGDVRCARRQQGFREWK